MCKVDTSFIDRRTASGESSNSTEAVKYWHIILTGDETWIYRHDPETNLQLAVLLFPDKSSPPPPHPLKKGKEKKDREKKERDQKYHRAYIRKRLLVAPEIWAMSPPILLRTDEQPLRTGTRIIVSRKSSTFWYQHLPKTGLPGLFLHHNNASAHTAATTIDVLNERDVQLLPHPPCSQNKPNSTWRNNSWVPSLRPSKMHVERSRRLLKTSKSA